MRVHALTVGAGFIAPLVPAGAASADFLGIEAVQKDITGFEDVVAMVVNLYAVFSDDDGDGIGDGLVVHAGGVPGMPTFINTRDGIFYQHDVNRVPTAPHQAFIDLFPSLAVDSFLTIGLKAVPVGGMDATGITPLFPPWGPDRLLLEDAAWFVTPDDPQGSPGNADNPADRVLLGQFSVAAGAGPNAGVFGMVLMSAEHGDGTVFQVYLSFSSQLPAPGAVAFLGAAVLLRGQRRRRA